MRSLVMKFTLLTGALIFAMTFMLMTLESVSAQRETRNLLIDRNVATLSSAASRLADSFNSRDVEFVGAFLTELRDNMGADEIYAVNNRREMFVEAFADPASAETIRASAIAVSSLGAGDIRYELTGTTLQLAVPAYTSQRRLSGVIYAQLELTELVTSRNDMIKYLQHHQLN